MKLTPSILMASDSSEARFSSASSLSSLVSPPRNRAPLVGASIKGSVTPSLDSSPRNRATLVVASEKGSVTPSEKGSVTPSEKGSVTPRKTRRTSSPKNRAPLVGASEKGSVTPSINGSEPPSNVKLNVQIVWFCQEVDDIHDDNAFIIDIRRGKSTNDNHLLETIIDAKKGI